MDTFGIFWGRPGIHIGKPCETDPMGQGSPLAVFVCDGLRFDFGLLTAGIRIFRIFQIPSTIGNQIHISEI